VATWIRKPHWEIGEALDIIDNPRGAKIAGSGFPVYKGAGSAFQRALISWFLDIHTQENGFTEVWPPAVVNTASATGTGQIPDKEDQMYVVTRDELYLVPTAEVPVTNLHRDEILDATELPIRYAAYTPCFRREAGAAGKDTRGILRVHQFDKVEMVLFERPEDSAAALEWMTERAEILLQRLGLAYRVLLMSTGEMGFTQAKKYDLEVWSPAVERWLEVSSCSNFRDYQARRMAIRYRPGGRSEARACPYAQRLRPGARARRRRHPRDVSASGRIDRGARGACADTWGVIRSPRASRQFVRPSGSPSESGSRPMMISTRSISAQIPKNPSVRSFTMPRPV
jgi:seryl-tRNA synthetase